MKPTFKGRLRGFKVQVMQVIGCDLSGVCRIPLVLGLLIFIPASVDAKIYLDLQKNQKKQQENYSRETELFTEIARLQKEGRYQDAIEPAMELLRIDETKKGPDHPHVAMSLTTLANIYRIIGDYAKAKLFTMK